MINTFYKKIFFSIQFGAVLIFLLLSVNAFSSDHSDASDLRDRCEKEIKGLEVSVKNFGETADIEEFNKGAELIKTGKVKFIQSKYTDAIENYNKYLSIQYNLYEILANRYIDRAEKLIDGVAEDLVDYINDKKVVEYLRLANQNLKDAKTAMATKHYKNIIEVVRSAKNYAISAYKLVGKEIPEQYKKDAADNEGKIFNKDNSASKK